VKKGGKGMDKLLEELLAGELELIDKFEREMSLQMEKMGLPTFTSEELEATVKSIHGAIKKSLWWKKEFVDALADLMVKRIVPPSHRLNAISEFLGFEGYKNLKEGDGKKYILEED
jgi:hypothetical protein